ncbi:hypothetical protein VTN49DRAFT_5432 [Thermomyces lanuginosus]|uniref:uncharacterized protein n=1 Tax=Thermomyces lanuginosus TaxID=5541 RepID=UPI0037430EA1
MAFAKLPGSFLPSEGTVILLRDVGTNLSERLACEPSTRSSGIGFAERDRLYEYVRRGLKRNGNLVSVAKMEAAALSRVSLGKSGKVGKVGNTPWRARSTDERVVAPFREIRVHAIDKFGEVRRGVEHVWEIDHAAKFRVRIELSQPPDKLPGVPRGVLQAHVFGQGETRGTRDDKQNLRTH